MPALSTVVVGEALVDVVERPDSATVRLPGGSGANTAVALARLGKSTTLSTCLALDDDGLLIAEWLEASGAELLRHPIRRTSTARAVIDSDHKASYDFDVRWKIAPALPELPDHLHVGSLGVVLRPGARAVAAIAAGVRKQATITYDVNLRPDLTGTGRRVARAVTVMMQVADVVKLSDEDIEGMWPGEPVDEGALAILALGPKAVVVTRGAAGASWFGRGGRVDVPGEPAVVVDTIGAGDSFSAAMISALMDRGALGPAGRPVLAGLGPQEWREVLDFCVRAAAVTVSRQGADAPWAREL